MAARRRVAGGALGVVVLALCVLIARELRPARGGARAAAPEPARATPAPAVVATTTPATSAPVAAPAATVARAAASDGLVRARALASIIHAPDSRPSEGVFHDRFARTEQYAYEGFGPFRRGELVRDMDDPEAWEIDGSNGRGHPTRLEDVAPARAIREAATVRDEAGNLVGTWYAIDDGPLAPAFATLLPTGGARVVSRAYLQAHRSAFPPSLVAALDR
jgi:hypothetical protein